MTAIDAEFVQPWVVLLGKASLARGGSTLLAQLVLTVGLLIGAACAVGLLWSGVAVGPAPRAGLRLCPVGAVLVAARGCPDRAGWTCCRSALPDC